MATLQDFQFLSYIDGVDQYLFIRRDGHIVSHNFEDPENSVSAVAMIAMNCEALQRDMGNKRCLYCQFQRSSGQHLIVFLLGNYYLCILQRPDRDNATTIENIITYLKKLTLERVNHSGIITK